MSGTQSESLNDTRSEDQDERLEAGISHGSNTREDAPRRPETISKLCADATFPPGSPGTRSVIGTVQETVGRTDFGLPDDKGNKTEIRKPNEKYSDRKLEYTDCTQHTTTETGHTNENVQHRNANRNEIDFDRPHLNSDEFVSDKYLDEHMNDFDRKDDDTLTDVEIVDSASGAELN